MKDKFSMTLEQNIFLAKRNIVDYIWKSANLEGIGVTFPETQQIYDGANLNNLTVSEVVAINNLKHGWQFLLDNIEYPVDYNYICKVNSILGSNLILEAGYIRKMGVRIGGTNWVPEIPNEEVVKEEIDKIHAIENVTERAITLMLYCMRTQIFNDGNKRTSMMVANQIMIQNGKGIITIPIEKQKEFFELLISYYETNEMDKLKEFIFEYCIDGITFEN